MRLLVDSICFHYGERVILDKISFSTGNGQILGLLGPNGTGKTTLLKTIGGFHKASSGSCYLNDTDLLSLNEKNDLSYSLMYRRIHKPFSL